ncbi:MAG: ATPase domain-containing protein [Candidatus Bathyarchaeia archaeon]
MEPGFGLGRRLSTGCDAVDGILGGGFRFGEVSLVYGEASTGKTTIALSCVVNHLRGALEARAFYIDADHRLSTHRLMQMAGGDGDRLLERILIWRPRSFSEQTEIVERMPNLLTRRSTPVVVDSITGLYRLDAGDAERTFIVNKELNRQLGFLSETAKTRDAAVLLVGQVHSIPGETPQVEPVAQRLLRYWSETVLRLEATPTPGMRQAVLEKPGGEQRACRFILSDAGLTDVRRGW